MLNLDNALYLHTGGERISRNEIGYIPTPDSTNSFCPVPHNVLLDEMYRAFSEHNIQVLQEQFAVAKQGQRLFGVMELESDAADYSTVIAVRNAHDHSNSIRLGIGTGVWVCDNMAFSAEFQTRRKHTTHVLRDLPRCVSGLIATAQDARRQQQRQIEAYKNTPLSTEQGHHLIVVLAKNNAFPPHKLLSVEREFETPSHEEFVEHGHTAWTLMNAVTEHLKGTSLLTLPDRTRRMHSVLDHYCAPAEVPPMAPQMGQLDFDALLQLPVAA